MKIFTKKINRSIFACLTLLALPLVGFSADFIGSWTSVSPSTGCVSATGVTYTLTATNAPSGGGGTANSYVAAGKTIIVTFPGGFGLAGCNSGSVNGTAIASAITKTATTISFETPVIIAKGAAITIILNTITNHATAANYQLSMVIDNATGAGAGNQNTFAAGATSQFPLSTVPTASPVSSAATSVGCTSFSANWSAASGANNYFLDVATNNTFTAYVTGYQNLNVGNVTTFSVTGLTGGTQYFYRIRSAINLCQRTTPSATQTLTTGVCYCTSNASATTYSHINNVTFNTINNNSNDCVGYTDFTGISTVVNPNLSYNLTISKINNCTGTTAYTGRFAAWIDWNLDGVFGAGEQVLTDAAASNGPVTVSVTVPAGATIGTTRMRCIFREGATVPPVCGAYGTWGETEDYSIIIAPLVNCSGTPTAGTITPATSTITSAQSVNLNWSQLPQAGMVYQWQSASSLSGPWTNISGATASSYNATGLSAGITYFRLVITCTNSGFSATSGTAQVTVTLVYCTPGTLACVTGGPTNYHTITRVQFGTLDNSSAATSCGTNGYTDYTGTVAAPTFVIGSSNNLSITNGGTLGPYSAAVWIDYNQNGSFLDPGEYTSIGQGTIANGATTTVPVNIPTTANTGSMRMRIQFAYGNAVLSSWTCFTNATAGETEDYLINLVCGATPSDITGRFPANGLALPCGSAATLSWNSHTCATSGFKVYLGTTNPPTTLVSNSTSTTYYTGNLASNTTYYWKIVPVSGGGDGASSTWSFITQSAVITAISQDTTGCTDTGVCMQASGGAYPNYYWYNVPVGGTPISSSTSYCPTGLTSPTTFYVSNVLQGPPNSINASTTSNAVCSSTSPGYGTMFDVKAKSANITVTDVSVMFRDLGNPASASTNKPVKVYYRPSSYSTNPNSSAGWILIDNLTVPEINTPTGPKIINITDVFIPAGSTYGFYMVYDCAINTSAGLFSNVDVEVATGSVVCGSEFGAVYPDVTFRGTVYYNISCSSPTVPVVATPWVSSGQVTLAPTTATALVERCTEGGWTYYARSTDIHKWLFAINKNGNTFTSSVDIVKGSSVYTNINAAAQHGSFLLPRYWNVTLTSGSINPALPVGVRFFVDTAEIRTTINSRDFTHANAYPTTFKTAWRWFKSIGVQFDPNSNINGNIFLFPNETPSSVNSFNIAGAPYSGFINNVAYVQLGGITSFSGGTGGVGFTPDVGGVLPIELLSFNGKENEKYNKLYWVTASEQNNDYFIIERSADGFSFQEIGKVKGANNSSNLLNYSFDDYEFHAPISYYRLKQFDFDGGFSYSSIIVLNRRLKSPDKINLYPNPSNGMVTLDIVSSENSKTELRVLNSLGQSVFSSTISVEPGQTINNIDLSNFPKGFYMLELNGMQETKLIKFSLQ